MLLSFDQAGTAPLPGREAAPFRRIYSCSHPLDAPICSPLVLLPDSSRSIPCDCFPLPREREDRDLCPEVVFRRREEL